VTYDGRTANYEVTGFVKYVSFIVCFKYLSRILVETRGELSEIIWGTGYTEDRTPVQTLNKER